MKNLLLRCTLLASAALPALAGDPNPAGAKTDFDPRRHGFNFVNSFEGDMLIQVPMVGTVDVGESTYGLCGGMSFSALDAYFAGLEVPDYDVPGSGGLPDEAKSGQPLRSYIYGRQMDSLRADDARLVRRLIVWGALPIHSNWLVKGLAERTKENFREKIAPAIDRGCPVPLLLVKADLGDYLPDLTNPTLPPSGYTKNHQVAAIGYRRHTRGADHWDIDIYDPNYPGEVHTLHLGLRVQTARVQDDGRLFPDADDPGENRRGRFRGLFRTPYDEVKPSFLPSQGAAQGVSTVLAAARGNKLKQIPRATAEEDATPPAAPGTAAISDSLDELEARLELLERRAREQAARARASGPVVVALDATSDYQPVHPTGSLPAGTRELSVLIAGGAASRFQTLTAVFVAEEVGDAAPPGTEIARNVQPSGGALPARFRYSLHAPMPAGSYRVEILGDGQPWQSLPFRVEETAPEEPADFELTAGRRWSYSFAQVAGGGVDLVDDQGSSRGQRLEAAVEIRVASAANGRARIEILRDGALVSQETWGWDDVGLYAFGRVLEGDEYALDPPQLLLARAGGAFAWDQSVLGTPQNSRQWGPVELEGPWGRGTGFLVLTEQVEGPIAHTVEREFVPGIGLVRERISSAHNGTLVSRQEMVLRRVDAR